MALTLEDISLKAGSQHHLYPMSLALQPNALTVLLGATQAGKTSLMRVMAGLDVPSTGRVRVEGEDVTRVPVRERNVAMVYQQFINYPSMTVYDNIASPLKLRGGSASAIRARVEALAQQLHIEPFLQRLPAELSGGQQQRVALARALAKEAPLMFLDEPLVNLDYKLREELREELGLLFAQGRSTVVYATTEPGEALLLGGYTAVMDAGELLQYGPTVEVFHRPSSIRVAKAFSDPPMNLWPAQLCEQGVRLRNGLVCPLTLPPQPQAECTTGIRAGALRLQAQPGDLSLHGQVELSEVSGSDTYVHTRTEVGNVVLQIPGIHTLKLDAQIDVFFSTDQLYVFDAAGALLQAPAWKERH